MDWTQTTIKALADYYSSNGGVQAVDAAIAAVVPEVHQSVAVTNVNFEGAAGSGMLTQKPVEILAGLYLVKQCMVEGIGQANQVYGRTSRKRLEV